MEDFERAIKLKPDVAILYFEKGRILRTLGRTKAALTAFDVAIRLDHQSALFHTRRGDVLRNLQSHGEAEAAYEQALQIDPDFEDAKVGRRLLKKPKP